MKCHCRKAHCRQSPTSCTLKSIATPKTPHYHTQMTYYECFLILITFGRKCAKATSHLSVSIDGQHSKVVQKPKAMRYAFLPKRTGLSQNISDNCFAHVTRLPRQGCRHRSPTCSWKSMRTRQNRHSLRCPQVHKKPPHARQRKPMRKAAK